MVRTVYCRLWLASVASTCAVFHLVSMHTLLEQNNGKDLIAERNGFAPTFAKVNSAATDKAMPANKIPFAVTIPANKTKSPGDTNHERNERELPYFILHVGPPKTATTTLQCSMRRYQDTLLKADNYHVLETVDCRPNVRIRDRRIATGYGSLHKCVKELNRVDERNGTIPQCWRDYVDILEVLGNQGKHVIISNEVIARTENALNNTPVFVDHLAHSLKSRFRVVVVVVYRRWFQWLPSSRSELFKPKPDKPRLHRWPSRGGRLVPTFDEYLSEVLRKHAKFAFVHTIVDAFRGKLDIRIMNMHAGDVETNFYCNALPDATETCRAMLNRNASISKRENTGVVLDYDILTTGAYHRGLIVNDTLGRVPIGRLAKEFHEKNLGQSSRDFPKVCPPTNLTDRVLERSMLIEKLFMPNEFHAVLEKEHQATFTSAMKHGLLCTIDVDQVLRDDAWISFYKDAGRGV